MGVRGELFSTKVGLQNRTYFFNVKENRLGDLYLNIVESKNRDEGGFERQSVILFAEDLQEFLRGFDESLRVLEKAIREKKRSIPRKSPRPDDSRPFETGDRARRKNDDFGGRTRRPGGGFDGGSKPRRGGRNFGQEERPSSRRSGDKRADSSFSSRRGRSSKYGNDGKNEEFSRSGQHFPKRKVVVKKR
jgi:hypothetical protein